MSWLDKIVKIEFLDHFIFEKETSLEKFKDGQYITTVIGTVKEETEDYLILSTWNGLNIDQPQIDGYGVVRKAILKIALLEESIEVD
jgi:hypothetical protein